MADNLTTPTTMDNLYLKEPITIEELQKAYPNKLAWHAGFNSEVNYDAVPVFVHRLFADPATGGPFIEFSLVDCDSYNDPSKNTETFEIPLDDYNVCHEAPPSTVRDKLAFGGPNVETEPRIVFLMIRPTEMPPSKQNKKSYTEMAKAASSPITPSGKWPMTTAATVFNFVRMTARLREEAAAGVPITPERIDQLRKEFGVPTEWPEPPRRRTGES